MYRPAILSQSAVLPARELTAAPENVRDCKTPPANQWRYWRHWSWGDALQRLHRGTVPVLAMLGCLLLGHGMVGPQPALAFIPGDDGGGGVPTPPPPLPVQGEAKPVRLTTFVGNFYLESRWEGNDDVFADVQVPGEGDGSWETWYLVDWNGGLLTNGDPVSLATKQEREPWYLRAQNDGCVPGARADARARATITAGIGASEIWTILKVSKPGNSSGNVIRAGDTVALRSANGCLLDFANGTGQPIRVDDSTIDDFTTWRLWQKVLPAENDDFPGHTDWCFGGQGAGCWDNPGYGDDRWWTTTDASGNTVSVKTVGVTVGSIVHDQCCLRRPLGKNCGGVFSGNEFSSAAGRNPGRGTMAVFLLGGEIWHSGCESEWQKAWDADTFYKWPEDFGPYLAVKPCPNCQTTGKHGWGYPSDELHKRANFRDTAMPFNRTFPTYVGNPYNGFSETTTYPTFGGENISAPPGQWIEKFGDRDFCESGEARYSWGHYECR